MMKTAGRRKIDIRSGHDGPDMKVSLTLRFNPEELGSEKTGKLVADVFNAVAAHVTPVERAEMLRQFDAAFLRWRQGRAA
jgi:hypothetical protein